MPVDWMKYLQEPVQTTINEYIPERVVHIKPSVAKGKTREVEGEKAWQVMKKANSRDILLSNNALGGKTLEEYNKSVVPPMAQLYPSQMKDMGQDTTMITPSGQPMTLRKVRMDVVGYGKQKDTHPQEMYVDPRSIDTFNEMSKMYTEMYGKQLPVGEFYRSPQKSNIAAMKKAEAAPAWQSVHNYGGAMDINTDPMYSVDVNITNNRGEVNRVRMPANYALMPLAKEFGWDWGGNWSSRDRRPIKTVEDQHYEIPNIAKQAQNNINIARRNTLYNPNLAQQYVRYRTRM